MNIKLIALDMDGTALKNDGTLSPRTAKALTAAMENGIAFVPTTGRMKNYIPKAIMELPGWRYAVTSNGASVWDLKEDRVIAANYLDTDLIEKILDGLEPLCMYYEVYSGGNSYAEGTRLDHLNDFPLSDWHLRFVIHGDKPVQRVENMREFIKTHPVEKIFLPDTEPQKHQKAYEILKEFPILITSSTANNLELNHPSAHKGKALEELCNFLGIKREEVMAAGDNNNDYQMLAFAGLAVAMGNAIEGIKEISDYVTLSNEEDGVAAAIEKFVLL